MSGNNGRKSNKKASILNNLEKTLFVFSYSQCTDDCCIDPAACDSVVQCDLTTTILK